MTASTARAAAMSARRVSVTGALRLAGAPAMVSLLIRDQSSLHGRVNRADIGVFTLLFGCCEGGCSAFVELHIEQALCFRGDGVRCRVLILHGDSRAGLTEATLRTLESLTVITTFRCLGAGRSRRAPGWCGAGKRRDENRHTWVCAGASAGNPEGTYLPLGIYGWLRRTVHTVGSGRQALGRTIRCRIGE